MNAIRTTGAALGVPILALSLASCDLNFVGDKQVTEDTLREYYESGSPFVLLEAAQRLLLAIDGNQVPGVTLMPNGNRVDGTIGMDFDYNGSLETEVVGNVQFPNANMSFDDGAQVTISGVTGSRVDGSMSATATTVGASTVAIDGTGSFQGDSDDPVDLDLDLSVTPAVGLVLGTVDIDAGDLTATAFYEDNGSGGFRVRIVGDDFEFTVGDGFAY